MDDGESVAKRRIVRARIAIGGEDETETGATGGFPVIARVADHQGLVGGDTEIFGGLHELYRVGLPCGETVTADDEAELPLDAGAPQQFAGEALAFVRDAAQAEPAGLQRLEGLDDVRIQTAVTEQVLRVTAVESLEREREQGGLAGTAAESRGDAAADQGLDAVADPGSDLGEAGPAESDRAERLAEAVCEIRRRVDERAVEIERDEPDAAQNTRTAISAGAASSSSSSLSRRSIVSEAPAISSEVQYSPT